MQVKLNIHSENHYSWEKEYASCSDCSHEQVCAFFKDIKKMAQHGQFKIDFDCKSYKLTPLLGV